MIYLTSACPIMLHHQNMKKKYDTVLKKYIFYLRIPFLLLCTVIIYSPSA